jgi:Transposase DNA-binding/Transposase DDE domain
MSETTVEADGWVEAEFAGAEFGDRRLSRRILRLAASIADHPERSLPSACEDDGALEAAYRFFNNHAVTPEAILGPHVRATVQRCAEQETVLAVHDTTTLGYRANGKRSGLGPHGSSQQFFAHATLAVGADAAHVPLGVLGLKTYARKGDGGDGSELHRWLLQARTVSELGIPPSRLVHVMDREADCYELIAGLISHSLRFVIRGDDDHSVIPETLGVPHAFADVLASIRMEARREVPISTRQARGRHNADKRKRHPPRNARVASLHIGAARITLKRPKARAMSSPETCGLNVVHVWEPSPPPGEPAVRWILLTTEPIDTTEQVLAIVDIYRARWRIEELFKALKTGCAFERKQLESYDALVNALALYLPIAWRLLHLRSQTQVDPHAPASSLLNDDELSVLHAIAREPLPSNPVRRDVLLAIAALGGHLKRNGEPGWQTLGRGWEHLSARVEGFRLGRMLPQKCDQS